MKRLFAVVTLLLAACGGGSSNPASAPTDSNQPVPSLPPPAPPPPAPSTDPSTEASGEPSTEPSSEPSTEPEPSEQPVTEGAPAVRPHADHAHCGWIGADTAAVGTASFVANADWFDAVHPKWFTLKDDGTPRSIAFTDDATVTQTARAHGVKLIPLIDAGTADMVRKAAANPAAHAQIIVDLVMQHGYDGIELDYEHLWTKADRAPFTALVQAVAVALHAQGKQLSLALPSLWRDMGDNGYDYAALQQSADIIHLMGYDYHWLAGPHLGPIAPLGWITNVVTRVESLGAPQKYVLGVANYGIGSGWYTTGADAVAQCAASYASDTQHMAGCSLGQHEAAGLSPHCTTPKGELWFEDAASVGEKAALAKAHHLAGMTYWTVGAEPTGFMNAITAQYP